MTGTADCYAQARVPVSAAAPEPCRVAGDADALRRMLVNLIDNAVRYARTRVTVAAGPKDGSALVTVSDDGPGIAACDQERAFERFTTLDDARARRDGDASGAGLGLAIVRATAHAHGGTAWLETPGPGCGSRSGCRWPGHRRGQRLRLRRCPRQYRRPDRSRGR